MSGTTDVFARVKLNALLNVVGWGGSRRGRCHGAGRRR